MAKAHRESLWRSFRCAGRGLSRAFLRERNLRIQAGIGALVVGAGLTLGLSANEWALVLLTIAAVIGAEMFNSAIEAIVDLVSPENDELASLAKDIAAGATLVVAVASALVGIFVFGHKIWLL